MKHDMNKTGNQKLKISAIIGFLFFLVPLSYQIIWICIFYLYHNPADRFEKFKTIIPAFLQEPHNAAWFFIAFLLIAIIFLTISLRQRNIPLRILSIVTLVLTSLLTLLFLFSLM